MTHKEFGKTITGEEAKTLMLIMSNKWEERFLGEILELKIRIERFEKFIEKHEDDACCEECKLLWHAQLNAMMTYMDILVTRAIHSQIDIGWIFENEEGED